MANRNDDLIVKLRLSGAQFSQEFEAKFEEVYRAADEQGKKAGARTGGSFVKGFLGSAAFAGLGTAIGAAISKSVDLGAEISDLSKQFNISVEEIQVWRQAAANAGVSATNLTDAFGGLTQRIGEANSGNRQAQQSFVSLGVGFRTVTGEARATDAVMLDVAKRLSEIQDPAERSRLGVQIFGDQFKTLHPLLLEGADGLRAARDELGQFGAMLSADEIRNLEKTNAKIEQMKSVLAIRIASTVAENADAVMTFTDQLMRFSLAAINAANDFLEFTGALSKFDRRVAQLPSTLSIPQRDAAISKIAAESRQQERETVADFGPFGRIKNPNASKVDPQQVNYFTPGMRRELDRWLLDPPAAAAPPRFTGRAGGGGGGSARAGAGGRARTPTDDAAEKAARQAADKALRDENAFREAIARTLRAQQDSAEVERIRAQHGEKAAAEARARLDFERANPLAVNDTVEALAAALGISEKLTAEKRAQLQADVDATKLAKKNLVDAAGQQVDKRAADEAQREFDRKRDRQKDDMERAIFDLASVYETAMRGGTQSFLDLMKDEGTRIIAEIAAQWTLSMIAKQPFSFNSALDLAMGNSPLGSIFAGPQAMRNLSSMGGLASTRLAANDNALSLLGGEFAGVNIKAAQLPLATKAQTAAAGGGAAMLKSGGFSLALGSIASSLVPGGNSTIGQIGGMAGSIGGMALGGKLAALGSFGGPIGAVAGAVIGTLLGGLLDGGFGPKRGQVTIGNAGGQLGILGGTGKSDLQQQVTGGANSLIETLNRIASQIGATVDPSRGSVSIGVRDGDFRVDPTGRGTTRVAGGAIDFGKDDQAAIRFALTDLIRDGVLTGISQASQNLLSRTGTDLEKQLEKVMAIESVPRLLRERMDPLGAAMDELFDKFKFLADAMAEAGASAEQVAQAQRLWELEKADTIASIGSASQTLNDFLSSLNAGSNSPLSLREQRAEAERQFEPFLAQIASAEASRAEVERLRASGASPEQLAAAETAARTAAMAIDQRGFTDASQLLLSISRASNASSGAFFSDFDRIRALTGQAAGFVDSASAASNDGRDPFGRETAQNTAETVFTLQDHTKLLMEIRDSLTGGGGGGGVGSGFTAEPRLFAA